MPDEDQIKIIHIVDPSNCPSFKGKPGENFERFLSSFLRFSQANGSDTKTKRRWFPWSLKGYAVDFYESLDDAQKVTLDAIVKCFRERFPVSVLQEAALDAAANRYQRSYETVEEYGAEIWRLFQNYGSADAESRTRLAQSFFLRGLRLEIKERRSLGYESYDRAVGPQKCSKHGLIRVES